jgi:hypothetical protein
VRDQLEALQQLAHVDEELAEFDREAERIPAHVKELDSEIEILRKLLEREREQLTEAESWDRQAEREVKIQEDLLGKSRAKQGGARNEREVTAAAREIDAIRKAMTEKDEERLQVMQAIAERRENIAKHEAEVADLQSVLDAADAEAREKLGEVDGKRKHWIAEREKAVAKLQPRTLRLYEHVRKGRGNAIAQVIGETCQGCNMSLPPQIYIEVQRAERIHQCPYCSRIIYFARPADKP